MTSERPINPRYAEDTWFEEAPGGPPRYRDWTDKPVRYFVVVDKKDGAVLGYVWAGDEDDAAAWEPRQAAGPRALMESLGWFDRLGEAKGRGIRPSQALAELMTDSSAGKFGQALPGSLAEAPNAGVVEELAKRD
ncbi:hypothetical protein ACFYPC_07175 [Streptomyces sp. NPDC005808]|uniref:hypothetical protein n=1 Tax=Streptomyces sp. NPDC005808 TaxID=3364734 RepID=UPI0036CD33DF